jgi:hypothetical protein
MTGANDLFLQQRRPVDDERDGLCRSFHQRVHEKALAVGRDIVDEPCRTAPGTGQPHPLPSPAATDPGFALVVLPREMTDRLVVATEALGGAAGTREERGRMAYVFYDRVEQVARTHLHTGRRTGTYDFDDVVVLAHAMAHEIGHLLLPYGHSATGLMRANWDEADLRRAIRRQLNFTTQQAESIRARLLTLPGGESPVTSAGNCPPS